MMSSWPSSRSASRASGPASSLARQMTGVRESRRIRGRYTLSVKDIYEEKVSERLVAMYVFLIDIHDPTREDLQRVRRKGNFCYDIPYDVILPQRVENLLVTGAASRLRTRRSPRRASRSLRWPWVGRRESPRASPYRAGLVRLTWTSRSCRRSCVARVPLPAGQTSDERDALCRDAARAHWERRALA